MSDKREFFNRLASNWAENGSVEAEKLQRVVQAAEISPGQTILDAGAGTGVLVPFLLTVVGPSGRVYALDFAPGMVEKMTKRGFPKNVTVILGDIHQTNFPDKFFDRVIANASFPHFSDQRVALKEIHRILKKGGTLIVSHPAGREWVNQHHRQMAQVAEDVVFPAPVLAGLLQQAGFVPSYLVDEPEFYLVAGKKAG
ncbi:MAG: class I SAM-dependent methyltransferase [Candidatus Omnitrophica bacterium]|nr:class I SAM-dependent methyltransferase [Candidatus Omnitrophota bacterium]